MPAAPLTTALEPPPGEGRLVEQLERFLRGRLPAAPPKRLLVAVSGGVDSTALLWGMTRLADRLGLEIHAAHLDHGLDPGSGERATAVTRLCARLGVPLRTERLDVAGGRRAGESPEATARRMRYRYLERERRQLSALWVLTAHHADDQAETVLLRLLYGSGLAGLAGIGERHGKIVRPLLGLTRRELAEALAATGLRSIEDPTNRDLRVPRNLVRHRLIPALEPRWPSLAGDLQAIARVAGGARRRLDGIVEAQTEMRVEDGLEESPDGISVSLDRAALLDLPDVLWPFALARAGRLAGLPYPPSRDARRELKRQLAGSAEVGCDQGDGWRWRSHGTRLRLAPAPSPRAARPFCHTFEAPGAVEIPTLGIRLGLRRSTRQSWMLRGAADRTGLGLRLSAGETVTVRSRRPGDRLKPLGCTYRRRLKEVLIDRQVPRRRRDRLPLLEVGGRIVWVPGVTVDNDCRLAPGLQVWLAEIEIT